MRITSGILAGALALAAASPAAGQDWGHLYGYVDWTTDYRYAGGSESDRHGVPQGGLHWAAPENFYAGAFVTAVDFRDFRRTSTEIDLYAGKHFYFDNNDLNVDVLYGMYPDTAGHPSYLPPGIILAGYNFPEVKAELTHSFGALSLGGRLLMEPRRESHGGVLWALGGNAAYAVTDWLTASAEFGNQWASAGPRGLRWDIGAIATWRQQWVFDLRYYGSAATRAECYHTNWCEAAVVAKLTYQFEIL
jgi:uncharacterized protein (TIGR02001 family)